VVEVVVLRPSRNHHTVPPDGFETALARLLNQRRPVVEEVVLRRHRWLRRSFYDRLETTTPFAPHGFETALARLLNQR
jgi:hypothetical protein